MRVSAWLPRSPDRLRSLFPHSSGCSLYAGLFVVKLVAGRAHCAVPSFYRPPSLARRQEREVSNKSAKECVCDRCWAFFCHLKHAHCVPCPMWLFWTCGQGVAACFHILHEGQIRTLCSSLIGSKDNWVRVKLLKTSVSFCSVLIGGVQRNNLASLFLTSFLGLKTSWPR